MKTADEKADEFIHKFELYHDCDEAQQIYVRDGLLSLLKEQDIDTRHACADALSECGVQPYDGYINLAEGKNACMNVKSV